ncbi:MAG: hypothetical protein PHQ05_11765 [Sterolibacterium sp.]|nr:hypothetical protein [Sterolibacterium sp.]
MEAWCNTQAKAIKTLDDAAGTMSPFQSGFIEAIAEYLHFINTTGTPDLFVWKPDAALSETELADERQRLEASYHRAQPAHSHY